MHCEDLLVNYGSNWQAVETVGEGLPQFNVVSAFTFIIKAVYPIDARTFVIPSQDEEVFRVFDLVRKKETDCFKGLFTSVYVVTEKEVICFWREAAIFEESEEVVVLTVDVTTNLDWSFQFEQDWLVDENFSRFGTEVLDLVLLKLYGLARSISPDF